jgi:hypothetical protein
LDGTHLTNAHVIPASIGGRLEVKFLCFDCNSLLGHTVESGLVADPSIASCINAVMSMLPARLRRQLLENMRWIARADFGIVEGRLDDAGQFHPRQSSAFLTHENARARLGEEWKRMGVSNEEMTTRLARLGEGAPDFIHVPAAGGEPVPVDPNALQLMVNVDAAMVPSTLPLSIAFTYLCLYLGKTAYAAAQLQPVREALLTNDVSSSEHWAVDSRRYVGGCGTEHRVGIKQGSPVVVHVQLFQQWVWWVTFPRIGLTTVLDEHYGIDVAENGGEFMWNAAPL